MTLEDHPLPRPEDDEDKDSRGTVLVVAGAPETPGAALLSGIAALRAGAGKLKIATAPPNVAALGVAVPEALVMPIHPVEALLEAADDVDAVLVGPGLTDDARVVRELATLEEPTLIVDAGSLAYVPDRLPPNTALIPNQAESEERFWHLGATVAVRGTNETVVAAPDGRLERDDTGGVGLATSGSGDVLAGIAAGLAARGADPFTAVVWAVHVHGLAGERLALEVAEVGFLARDLLDEIPGLLAELARQ